MALTPEQIEPVLKAVKKDREAVETIRRNYAALHREMLKYHGWFVELRDQGTIGGKSFLRSG